MTVRRRRRGLAARTRDRDEAKAVEDADEHKENDAQNFVHGRSSAPAVEPAHHNSVEHVGMLDIGEMPGVGDLLVASAGDELGDALVAGGWRAGIVAAAHHQGRYLDRGELRDVVEIEDRRGAAQEAGGRGAGDGRMDLLPALRIATL